METPVNETVGTFLKRSREGRLMSLAEVSRITRIPLHALESIERDREGCGDHDHRDGTHDGGDRERANRQTAFDQHARPAREGCRRAVQTVRIDVRDVVRVDDEELIENPKSSTKASTPRSSEPGAPRTAINWPSTSGGAMYANDGRRDATSHARVRAIMSLIARPVTRCRGASRTWREDR